MNESYAPSNYWLLCIIYVCHLLNHITYPKDPKIPDHRLTTDGGECGSPTGPSEGSKPKILSTRVPNGFFKLRCDQDPSTVKPMPVKPMSEFGMGRKSQRKVTEFKGSTSH